jgi:hypothetical protein
MDTHTAKIKCGVMNGKIRTGDSWDACSLHDGKWRLHGKQKKVGQGEMLFFG